MARTPETKVKFSIFNKEFNEGIREMKNESTMLRKEFTLQDEQLKSTGSAADRLALKMQHFADQQSIVQRQVQATKTQLDKAKTTYGDNSNEANKLSNKLLDLQISEQKLSNAIQATKSDLSRQSQSFNEAKSAAEKYGQAVKDAGEKAKSVGEASQGASIGAAAGGGLAAKTAVDVDAAERLIIASIGGTAEQAKVLKEDFRAVYRDGFGDGPEDIARAMALVKANIQGINEGAPFQQATKDAITLAKVTDSDVSEVTRGVNQLMHNFGLTSQEAFDLFAAGNQKGLNYSNEMFDNVSEYSPLFKQMGFSADEYFQILANGSQNGAYNLDYVNDVMKEFDIRMRDGSKTTSDAMSQMSTETQNMFEKFKEGKVSAGDMFRQIIPELQNMDDQVLATQIGVGLFGTKFEDLGNKTVYAMDDMNNSFETSKGKMEEVSSVMEESFGQKLQSVLRNLGLALEPIGRVLLDMLDQVTPAIESFAKWFENLDPVIQTVIGAITGLVAIFAPLVTGVGMLFTFVAPLVTAFMEWVTTSALLEGAITLVSTAIGLISAPVLIVVGVITALVGVFIYLWNTSEDFRTAVTEIWNSIVETIMTVVNAVVQFVMTIWGTLVTWWQQNNQLIMQTIMTVWNFIAPFIMGVIQTIIGIVQVGWTLISTATQIAWNAIVMVVKVVWTVISTAIQVAINLVLGIIRTTMQIINGDWSGAWNTIKQTVSTIWNLILNAIKTILMAIFNFIVNTFNTLKGAVSGIVNGIKTTLEGIFNALKGAVISIFNAIKSFVTDVWNGIKTVAINAAQALYNGAKEKFGAVLSSAKSIFDSVKSAITGPIETAKSTVLGIIDKIVGAFANMRITIPKPKLPHISVGSKSIGVGKASVDIPTFGVEWYKKGGMFTRPAIAGGAGFGDVNEAIIPFEGPHASYFANLIGSAMNRQLGLSKDATHGSGGTQNFNINFTGYIREEADVDKVSAALAKEMRRKERGG